MRGKNLSNKPMICGKKDVMACGVVELLRRASASFPNQRPLFG